MNAKQKLHQAHLQEWASRFTDQKASGIGLYLCRRICNNLGHSISAASVPGEGTAIRIDLYQQKLETE